MRKTAKSSNTSHQANRIRTTQQLRDLTLNMTNLDPTMTIMTNLVPIVPDLTIWEIWYNVVNFPNWGNPTRVICLIFFVCVFCTENVNSKEKMGWPGLAVLLWSTRKNQWVPEECWSWRHPMYDRHTEPIEVAEKAFKILVLTGWLFYIYVAKHENKRQIKPWKSVQLDGRIYPLDLGL